MKTCCDCCTQKELVESNNFDCNNCGSKVCKGDAICQMCYLKEIEARFECCLCSKVFCKDCSNKYEL